MYILQKICHVFINFYSKYLKREECNAPVPTDCEDESKYVSENGNEQSIKKSLKRDCESYEVEDVLDKDEEDIHSPTNIVTLLLKILSCIAWCCIACWAMSAGTPARSLNPTNSQGETCGQAHQAGKPNLIYLDLTQCAGVQAAEGVCPTHTVCVENCPQTYWTSSQGWSNGLEHFCDSWQTESDMPLSARLSMPLLVEGRVCPAYLLPSRAVLGRCLPAFGLAEAKLEATRTADGKILNVRSLLEGVQYVTDSLEDLGYDEKQLAFIRLNWNSVLMSFLLCMVMSFISTLLITISPKPVLWTSTTLSIVFSLAGTVYFIMWYNQQRKTQDGSFGSWWLGTGLILGVISSIISIFLGCFFERIKKTVKTIAASQAKYAKATILLIPTLKSLAQGVLMFFSLLVSTFLSSTGSPEYRVVGACSSETCFNMNTGIMFAENDMCNPGTFTGCTGCPKAQCLFQRFGQNSFRYWLHLVTLSGMLWMLMIMTNWRQTNESHSRDNISFKNKSRKRLDFGRSWLYPMNSYVLPALEGTKKISPVSRKEINFLLLSAKLLIIGVVTFTTPVIRTLGNYDSNPIGLIIVFLVGLWAVTSSFLDGLFKCMEENMDKCGGSIEHRYLNESRSSRDGRFDMNEICQTPKFCETPKSYLLATPSISSSRRRNLEKTQTPAIA